MKVEKEGVRIRVTWESQNEEDVRKAGEFFANLTKQGWLAARKNGEYRRVLEFTPKYGELWYIPIAEGG